MPRGDKKTSPHNRAAHNSAVLAGTAGTPRVFNITLPPMMVPAMRKDEKGKMKPDPSKPLRPVLEGYYTSGKTPNWGRLKRYHNWKDHVKATVTRELANYGIELPAVSNSYKTRVQLNIHTYFFNGVHNDPENVRKGIVDALFPDGDKWVYGYHSYPMYDRENPRVEVEIIIYE